MITTEISGIPLEWMGHKTCQVLGMGFTHGRNMEYIDLPTYGQLQQKDVPTADIEFLWTGA